MAVDVTSDAIVSAPKALLHDHLDGGLRIETILELSEAIGWTPQLPTTDPADLQAWFTAGAAAKDLLKYLATFEHTLAVMQDPAHIERVAFEAVEDLANDGVVYAEIRFAPELHDMPFEASSEAICAGFRRAETSAHEKGLSISANLIVCAMRTERRSVEVVEFVDRYRSTESKVVAFDLAGAETGWPPSLHADALAIARQRHINVTIHASEPPDLELISDALAHGAHRIGHGVRLDRDTQLVNGELVLGPLASFIRDRQIHLEMAPTCNTQIGAVNSVAEHPVIPFVRAGFNVGVNTDNRLMSDVSPSSELVALHDAHQLSWSDIEQLVTNAISSGFAPITDRQHIIDNIVAPAYWSLANG
ncbi:MAG TPA: adenosine deaminase [Acidimicrobiaceae bacterium]|nr:adenosine deaminase [Acidimicrobiaceae bacterium]